MGEEALVDNFAEDLHDWISSAKISSVEQAKTLEKVSASSRLGT